MRATPAPRYTILRLEFNVTAAEWTGFLRERECLVVGSGSLILTVLDVLGAVHELFLSYLERMSDSIIQSSPRQLSDLMPMIQ